MCAWGGGERERDRERVREGVFDCTCIERNGCLNAAQVRLFLDIPEIEGAISATRECDA